MTLQNVNGFVNSDCSVYRRLVCLTVKLGIVGLIFFKNIVFSFLPYVTFLFIIAIKKIYFDRYYIQYILIPNFEKILKTKIQKKCSEIEIIDYEKNNINDKRRKPMNAENTIMKSMADMLCQQNLITPDEKSRLILLIDKERES